MIGVRQAIASYLPLPPALPPPPPRSIRAFITELGLQPASPISTRRLVRMLARGGPVARLGGLYATAANELDLSSDGLVGFADLHTHPAAHLGFGQGLFYGAPDGDPASAFSFCYPLHIEGGGDVGGIPFTTLVRPKVAAGLAETDYQGGQVDHGVGWPALADWPVWHDRLHQQVRVEMLERAWQGGLRALVAHAVNTNTFALLCQGPGNYDDKSAGDAQIVAIKEMVGNLHFAELALSPADLRDIVGRGKLAVIIGLELDCLGNFYEASMLTNWGSPPVQLLGLGGVTTDYTPITAEVERLFTLGVRYVFPVHVTDNVFGGCALYEKLFEQANRCQFGAWWQPEEAPPDSGIGFNYNIGEGSSLGFLDAFAVSQLLGFNPTDQPKRTFSQTGYRNSRGLQDAGRFLLDELMRRGMMIDVDHMSEKTMLDTLAWTERSWPKWAYPVFAGHNGIRPPGGNERSWLLKDATTIMQRGAMWGIGIKGGLGGVKDTLDKLQNTNGGFAFGSDCSGLEQLPAPRYPGGLHGLQDAMQDPWRDAGTAKGQQTVVYRDYQNAPRDALLRCNFGTARSYDSIYWTGFSHIGMYPDFLEDGYASGILIDTQDQDRYIRQIFQGVEALARAWETCLAIAPQIPPPAPL